MKDRVQSPRCEVHGHPTIPRGCPFCKAIMRATLVPPVSASSKPSQASGAHRGHSLYTEFRKDGWPLCPRCGEDELWSAGNGKDQSVTPDIDSIVSCYRCGWEPPTPTQAEDGAERGRR